MLTEVQGWVCSAPVGAAKEEGQGGEEGERGGKGGGSVKREMERGGQREGKMGGKRGGAWASPRKPCTS